MNLYAISAKARCGKDTAANYIRNVLGPTCALYALAECFKISISNHFKDFFTYDDVFGNGVDRNTEIFYIGREIVLDRVKMVFLDFGYDLDKLDIDFSVFPHKNGWTIRELMQIVGTDIGCDQIDRRIWLNEFDKFMETSQYDTVIITDCRQQHEMDSIIESGGRLLHILRDTGIEDSHSTEAGLKISDGDSVIENNGTLEEFYEKLDEFIIKM